MFGFLGTVYKERASHAFSVLKMFHHSTQSIAFAYAGYINIYWQIAILFVFGTFGTVGFAAVDIRTNRRKKRDRLAGINSSNSSSDVTSSSDITSTTEEGVSEAKDEKKPEIFTVEYHTKELEKEK